MTVLTNKWPTQLETLITDDLPLLYFQWKNINGKAIIPKAMVQKMAMDFISGNDHRKNLFGPVYKETS